MKNILSKKEVHNGYYIEVVQEDGTSNILNIHSSNSSTDIFKPRLEVEYVDPAQTVSKVEVESEINYKPISYLISELNLDFLVDKVDIFNLDQGSSSWIKLMRPKYRKKNPLAEDIYLRVTDVLKKAIKESCNI